MNIEESKQRVELFLKQCEVLNGVAKTAERNKQSLSGQNFYGNKFHGLVIEISRMETNIRNLIAATTFKEMEEQKFIPQISVIKATTSTSRMRAEALKQLQLFCKSELLPSLESMTANPVPATEQVLAMSVVQGTRRSYIDGVVLQANGSYEHQWYDACAVMIRRLVETLIIELYEAKNRAAEIKGSDGNFMMLNQLVDRIVNDTTWNLGRETKSTLPLLKRIGDLSAHARRYSAKKSDIDQVLPGLRIVVEELLHLSGLK